MKMGFGEVRLVWDRWGVSVDCRVERGEADGSGRS